jgi:hypothetical protein
MFEIISFRNADKIIKEKKMNKEVKELMEYIHDCLYGTRFKSELLRQALTENDWRQNGDTKILEGRRYFYKGYKNRVAIEGSFSSYEAIQDALLRLQIGYVKKKIDLGIVMLTSQRSEKSKLGSTKDLVTQEIEMLHPVIDLPVIIVLFDLGMPGEHIAEKEEPLPDKIAIKNPLKGFKSFPKPKPEDDDEDVGEYEVYGNAEERAYHDAQKKLKSRVKSRKAAMHEHQEAA